jgi:valyl-tRNA synthetase
MVRDAHGRKMSKSLGNVIDPLDVIQGTTLEKLHQQLEQGNLDPREVVKAKAGQKQDFPNGIPECGTDALRFTLCNYTSTNRDINMDIARVEGYRKFCNKLWNAIKFAFLKLGDDFVPLAAMPTQATVKSLPEKWILHRLNQAAQIVNKEMAEYNFLNATNAIYRYWLNEVCDVYIEVVKPIVDGDDEALKASVRQTLYTCLDQGLRLMHPYMPFLTEELFQRLPRRPSEPCETIMYAAFPEFNQALDAPKAETDFELINSTVKAIRSLMADYGLKNDVTALVTVSEALHPLFIANKDILTGLCFSRNMKLTVLKPTDPVTPGCVANSINEDVQAHVLVRGMVDLDAEINKLAKKMEFLNRSKESVHRLMTIPDYETKVPEHVRENNKTKLNDLDAEITVVQSGIDNFKRLKG